jgi:hypothetical protein
MTEDQDVFTNCGWCGKDIEYGNAVLSIDRNIAQMDSTDEYPEGVATIIEIESLLELCAQCGNKLDAEMLKGILMALKRK